MSAERILIIQMAKLGDFIQSTPLLANVRRQFPGAEIVLACEQMAVLEAASLSPLVDEAQLVKENGPLPTGPFTAIFTLNSHPRAMELAEKIPATQRYGPCMEGREIRFTDAQNFIMTLMRTDNRDLGRFNLADIWASLCPKAGPEALLWPPPCPSIHTEGLKIGFQLGSKNHLRRWPVENFAHLAQELRQDGLITPILVGSASEKAMGARFEKLFGGPVMNLMGRTTLEELAAALAGLDLLATSDTGAMHLAAAVGTPVLALFFGPAYGPETGPYGPGHLIYQAAAGCSPCRENADCRRRQCLSMPQVNIAAQAARLRLGILPELPAPLPKGHRVWRTALDSFGQSLEVLARPVLSDREALALIITEAARPIIRAGEIPRISRLMAALAAFDLSPSIRLDGAILRQLAAAPLAQEYNGAAFLAEVELLAANLGFKIA